MDESVGFEITRDGAVLILTFNRPEVSNSIPTAAVVPLTELFASVSSDRTVRAMLIRGQGRSFSAGGDVQGFARSLQQSPAERRADFGPRLDRAKALVEAYLAIDVPIVAACQGAVAGAGITYPLGADMVLADETVTFVFAHQRIGLTPDGGVSVLLPRIVGERKAIELTLLAASVKADEALRLGLVSRLVPSDTLQADALGIAHRLAAAPHEVVRRAKTMLKGALLRPASEQLELERDAIVASVGEPDFDEGIRAFIDKRAAVFPSTLAPA